MMKALCIAILMATMLSNAHATNEWVYGKIDILEDYGGQGGGYYQVLVTLTDRAWENGPSGLVATNCTQRYRIKVGEEGVTESIKNRLYATLLSAHLTEKRVALYVNPDTQVGGYCNVRIGAIGPGLNQRTQSN